MATLTISVPDGVLGQAKGCLGSNGNDAIEQYLISAIHALALDGTRIDPGTEAALLEGLGSPLEDMTRADWDALRQIAEEYREK
jgi:hypothetical protein